LFVTTKWSFRGILQTQTAGVATDEAEAAAASFFSTVRQKTVEDMD
jgi:hypothetical protein